MASDNHVTCYEAIQRIYRNSVVRFLRDKLRTRFPTGWENILRSPFKQEEWETANKNALVARATGELGSEVRDDFDLLSVNHFFNLFDSYYDVLFENGAQGASGGRREKQALLGWAKTIKALRDPLSHPSEQDLSREDAFQLLDCARRVLLRLHLVNDAGEIQLLMDKVLGITASVDPPRSLLEDSLPPRESIVVGFIGRDKELEELRKWFQDPVARRWALAGEGGKGKSALAYNFALEVKQGAPQPYQAVLWLSAKKRRFVEGETVMIETPEFSDLDSALALLLTHYGWIEEVDNPTETKRKRVLELLNEFPALLVVDDIDSLESENENVIEFFSLHVPETSSKVLFTSRRTIFGMGGSTTHVSGFSDSEAEVFLASRCRVMELDPALLVKKTVQDIVRITEGSPLFMEDLLRLATVKPMKEAIKLWQERGGEEARRYALGRECELLTGNARRILLSAAIWPGPVSFAEIEGMTGASAETVTAALQELQKLFLVPKPRLIGGEERFEINVNTRSLVRDVYGSLEDYRRIQTAQKTISSGVPKTGRVAVGALIRQAMYLLRVFKYQESEELLLKGLTTHENNPDLIGVLGVVYKAWSPTTRLTDAREKFQRAWQLKNTKPEMYVHWCRMEIREQEWTKATEAAGKGLKVLPNNRVLLYLSGYSRSRLAKEFLSGLHQGKAEKEMREARRALETALKASRELDEKDKSLNPDIYRALVLVCEMASDLKSMQRYFELWKKEYADDPDVVTEWERVSKKYGF